MINDADLPETIPVFPLTGALLLPRARLPLHVFEPRYLQMIEDCMKTPGRLIGMVQPMTGESGTGCSGTSRLHCIGCAGRLTAFSETEDNRYMITLTGVSRFRLKTESTGFSPYRKFSVNWADFGVDRKGVEHDAGLDRERFLSLLKRYFCEENLQTDWEGLCQAEDEMLINSLSLLCPFEPEDKQALLEAPTLANRRETLIALLEFALCGGTCKDMM